VAEAAPIRAILFDKDGTLVDFQRSFGPAVHEVMQHLAGGDHAAYDRLVAASRFVEADQRFLPDSPLIAEPTSVYGALWAAALGRSADAALFAEIDRLLCDATTRHLAAIGDPRALLTALAARGYRLDWSPMMPKSPLAPTCASSAWMDFWSSLPDMIPALAPSRTPGRSAPSRGPLPCLLRKSPSSAIPFTTLPRPAPRALSPSAF